MALNWTTTDRASINGVKCLVYGPSGAGKTRLCGTAPGVIFLSAEKGLLSLKRWKLPALEIRTVDDLNDAFVWVRDKGLAAGLRTVALDSISEIAEHILANAKPQFKDPRKAFGEMLEKTVEVIKGFRDLEGWNVVVTAKQGQVVDEATGAVLFGPSTPGKALEQELPYLFDEVLQISRIQPPDLSKPPYHWLRTRGDFQYTAKDRSDALDPAGEPADLNHVFQKISAAVA